MKASSQHLRVTPIEPNSGPEREAVAHVSQGDRRTFPNAIVGFRQSPTRSCIFNPIRQGHRPQSSVPGAFVSVVASDLHSVAPADLRPLQ